MAKKSPTTASKSTAEKPSNLFRRLTTVLLVNATEFAKATTKAQTALIAEAGLPVEFVTDFFDLGNKRIIRDKLLAGTDVSRELEFNGVVLSPEEIRAFDLIKPVLAKIEAIGPKYPWLKSQDYSGTITFVKHGSSERIQRNGHFVGKSTAEGIWKKASAYWSGGKKPSSNEVCADGYSYRNRTASYATDSVAIGCQTISRSEIEFIARHYNWEPVVTA